MLACMHTRRLIHTCQELYFYICGACMHDLHAYQASVPCHAVQCAAVSGRAPCEGYCKLSAQLKEGYFVAGAAATHRS